MWTWNYVTRKLKRNKQNKQKLPTILSVSFPLTHFSLQVRLLGGLVIAKITVPNFGTKRSEFSSEHFRSAF